MSRDAPWRIFTDVAAARDTILKRHSLRDISVPEALLERSESLFGERIQPEEAVRRIIRSVRERGDQALREWNLKLDNLALDDLRVPPEEMSAALDQIAPDLRAALKQAAERIRSFHQKQPLGSWIDAGVGGTLGQLIRPLDSVGVYVPGGTAPLPSSLLMSVIPAQVAGVNEDHRLHATGQRSGQHPSGDFGGRGHHRRRANVPRGRGAGHRGAGLRYGKRPARGQPSSAPAISL